MPLILGLETTCDETAASVVRDGREVLSSVVATQYHLHAKFRGVVPEIASRAHIERILPVIEEACATAGVRLHDIDAIAVANRPGLIGSLLIGVTAAKTIAFLLGKPLLAVNHVHAHLYSVLLRDASTSNSAPVPELAFPLAGAVLSGGHTAFYQLNAWTDITHLGGTIDDAIGEAFDKVAAILGLPFPGGPAVAALADTGQPTTDFPQPFLRDDSFDLSYSGVKTSVLYHALGKKGRERTAADLSPQFKADTAASFQKAVIDVLFHKLTLLHRHVTRQSRDPAARTRPLLLGGGVVSNRSLRSRAASLPFPILLPPPAYCTDNAAMSAGLGHVLLQQGQTATLDLDALPNTHLAASQSGPLS